MKVIKDVLLFLDSFDENNMFDFEHNNKIMLCITSVKIENVS